MIDVDDEALGAAEGVDHGVGRKPLEHLDAGNGVECVARNDCCICTLCRLGKRRLRGTTVQEPSQVSAGKAPFEGPRDRLIVLSKADDALSREFLRWKVVGRESLALKDRE